MNSNFWKNKKILLTGHTGFKGSWLSLWLQKLGSDVIGFSKDIPTQPSHFKEVNAEDGMESIMGDIRNYRELEVVFQKYEPEIVFHMAAQSIVHKSYEQPVDTYSTNVMGTVNLLEVARKTKTPKIIINITSDKCYRNTNEKKAFVESDPFGGFDPYSSSKGCSELITESFRNSFFKSNGEEDDSIGLASVRAGNVIGGGDWSPYRLIPDIIRSIQENQTIKIRNPNSVRHWQHVLDPLHGYLVLAEKLWKNKKEYSSGWNFGPTNDEGRSVSWILEKFSQLWKEKLDVEIENENFNHEANFLMLNSEKAKNELKWESKIELDDSIKLIVEWYKSYFEKDDLRKKSLEQIKYFESLITNEM